VESLSYLTIVNTIPDTLEQDDPMPCRDLARNRTPYVLPKAKTVKIFKKKYILEWVMVNPKQIF
jgi:hypothetical protein